MVRGDGMDPATSARASASLEGREPRGSAAAKLADDDLVIAGTRRDVPQPGGGRPRGLSRGMIRSGGGGGSVVAVSRPPDMIVGFVRVDVFPSFVVLPSSPSAASQTSRSSSSCSKPDDGLALRRIAR